MPPRGQFISYRIQVEEALEREARSRVFAAANEVRNEVLDVLKGPRTGRTYRIPGTTKTYTASAPGEPPAQRLGHLRQSVRAEMRQKGDEIQGIVGTDLLYGRHLELGTRKMKPRPWLSLAFARARDRIERILGGRWL